jgi:isopentenyl-diphosphate delta-isomerase type 1
MTDEMIDVVDDNDQVIGKKWKSVCHKTGLLHRTSTVFVFNSKGELLLQKRHPSKALYAGMWASSCAGHLLLGENYEECAIRELKEELDVTIDATKLAFIGKYKYETNNSCNDKEIYVIYLAHHDGPFNFEKSEMTEVKFFNINPLQKMMAADPEQFAPALFEEIEHYLNYIENDKTN